MKPMLLLAVLFMAPGVAVEAAIRDTPSPDADRVSSQLIQESARQVMARDDYRSARRRVLERVEAPDADHGFLEGLLETLGNWLSDALSWLGTGGGNRAPTTPAPTPSTAGSTGDYSGIGRLLSILVIGIALAVIIYLVVRLMKQHQHDPDRSGIPSVGEAALDVSVPPGELAASTYESRAREFAAKGDFAGAIRELLLGSMSWIERAGLIRFRRGLTNRDYVRAVWRKETQRDAYLVTGTEFELVFFGRRTATEEMFTRCMTAFQGAFDDAAQHTHHEA